MGAMDGVELCYLSAGEVLRRFAAGSLSPVELVLALRARAAGVEPAVNALVEVYWDEALAQARAAERCYRSGGSPRALEGVPFVVKDDTAVKGRRLASCSLLFADLVAEETNPTIERLIEAGAILIGRSACAELAWSWACTSPVHGVTRNPWNLGVTAGGSSGGSAAALAAGMATLATGTDSAGSVRMPAAMCGVVGFKPPSGRNPEGWEYLGDRYNEIGVLGRTVEDCVLMQNVVAGPHPLDLFSLRPKLTIAWPPPSVAGLSIAYSFDLGFMAIAPDVRRNMQAALDALRAQGASVHEVPIDWAREALDAADGNTDFFVRHELADVISGEKAHLVSAELRAAFAEVGKADGWSFMRSIEGQWRAWRAFAPVWARHDAFVCPTVATTAVPAEWKLGDVIMVGDTPVSRLTTTLLFNMFSSCPALSVPSGWGDDGVPTGVQIAARPYDDEMVFRVAAAVEAAGRWYGDASCRPALGG